MHTHSQSASQSQGFLPSTQQQLAHAYSVCMRATFAYIVYKAVANVAFALRTPINSASCVFVSAESETESEIEA